MPQPPPFPRSMLRASAAELTEEPLEVVEGEIPADLRGHLFLIAPVGSVSSDGLPNSDDSHVWNGNGLIHRFDLHSRGAIRLTTRLARTPCFWADLATRPGSPHERYGFSDWGMSRFSLHLGMRNQLNTAFVPMRFAAGESTRLLLTFDGGRPYEIDPKTLEVVTPVGGNNEWRPGADLPLPFPPVLSTAHPVFDHSSALLYTVNYGRSTGNFLDTIPLVAWLARLLHPLARLLAVVLDPLQALLRKRLGVADFVHLLAWDGQGLLRRWRLVDAQGQPLRIDQTMHQIGLSRDYLVLADTSLKFGIEQLLSRPFRRCPALNRLLRRLLTRPQKPDTTLYIVRRADLEQADGTDPEGPQVMARTAVIPLEIGHFLVEEANPNGRITLHAAHECATDVSEWVRPEDVSALDGRPLDPALRGMIAVGAMDVGRLGRYEIDGETGALQASTTLNDLRFTWGIGLYACRWPRPDGRIASIYWQSLGFWTDLLPDFLRRLYADYPHRLVPVPEVLGGAGDRQARPSALFRLDTATMTIADAYPFPQEQLAGGEWRTWVCNSPEFVPRPRPEGAADPGGDAAVDPDTDGWILCIAISEQAKQLWIFDAADLARGPLCRLAHPCFDPGYTIHTTWLEHIHTRSAHYRIGARADYEPRLKPLPDPVRELFERHVFPHVDPC